MIASAAFLGLLLQQTDVTNLSLPDMWFAGLTFMILLGAVGATVVMMGKNAPHSIGSMRSETSGFPKVATGGRFSGPAVHGRW
jgi:hypothetical protein